MKTLYALLSLLFCLPALCLAQYQEGLDPYFGTKGIVIFNESIVKSPGIHTAVQQVDGKIIAASGLNIFRLNNDGTLDKTFGKSGIFDESMYYFDGSTVKKLTYYGIGANIDIQTDGKILAMGGACCSIVPYDVLLLLRLMPDGSLDNSFGRNGIVCDSLSGNYSIWLNFSILPDGKILTMGERNFMTKHLILARYKNDGSLDSSFGTYGKKIDTDFRSPKGDIELYPDGRILVLGDYFGVGRYMPDGSPDISFNHTGYNSIFSGSTAPYSHAMALRPDGKIWVAGHASWSTGIAYFILGRFNNDGSIDSSFNNIGYQEYAWDTGAENKCRDMILLPDGKIVLGGRVMNKDTRQNNFALMRIHPDGRIDSSFGINGRLLTQMNMVAAEGSADLRKLLLQTDLKILGLGVSANTDSPTALSTMVRYYKNGMTGINTNTSKETVRVYPNPADQQLYIRMPEAYEALSITDIQGRLIYNCTGKQQSLSINVADYPNGFYLLHLKTNEKVFHQKIIIQH